jgi:hypothetical protein
LFYSPSPPFFHSFISPSVLFSVRTPISPALIYFIPSFLSSCHQCHVIFPLPEVFRATRFSVVSIRITLLLSGYRNLPDKGKPRFILLYIYLLRCTTAVVNYTLPPTEEPTHNTQANLWAEVIVHLCVQLMSASISRLFKQKTPKRCVETMESSSRTLYRRGWDEPRETRHSRSTSAVVV